MHHALPRRAVLRGGLAGLGLGATAACGSRKDGTGPAGSTATSAPLLVDDLDQAVAAAFVDTPWAERHEGLFAQLEALREQVAQTHPSLAAALSLVANDAALPLLQTAAGLRQLEEPTLDDVAVAVSDETERLQAMLPELRSAIEAMDSDLDAILADLPDTAEVLGATTAELQAVEVEARRWVRELGLETDLGVNAALLGFQEQASWVTAGPAALRSTLSEVLLAAEAEALEGAARRARGAPPPADCLVFELAVALLILCMVLVVVVWLMFLSALSGLAWIWILLFATTGTSLMLAVEALLALYLGGQLAWMFACYMVEG